MLSRTTAIALATLTLAQGTAAEAVQGTPFERYSLENGLKVILAPDPTVQVVTVNVWYDVGSRNERPGRTGFAHLFEHMMFQGSANAAKGLHMQLVERAGGSLNGSTSQDRTNYFQTLPSNRVNLGLWLEADRMRSLAITDANLTNQREAVKEEKRLNFDNPPYVAAYLSGLTAIADSVGCFGYAHPPIGSMEDLDAATTADVQAFFDLYYAPNNATLIVTGDFSPAAVKELIQEYFGSIPRGSVPPPVECATVLSPGMQRRRMADPKATLPAVLAIYRIPPSNHPDSPALELLATILGSGESSRLNRTLVRETKAAVASQGAFRPFGDTRGPGALALLGISNQGVSPDSLESLIVSEVAKLVAEGVTEGELTKVRNQTRMARIGSLQTTLGLSEELHAASLFWGDPAKVDDRLAQYLRVTREDILRVARTYLAPENSILLLIAPPESIP